MLTTDDVAKLAALARIELTDDELARLAPQIDVIVASVAGLAEVNTEGVPPTSHAVPATNVMRDDVPAPYDAPGFVEQLAAAAPAFEDGRFRVPRILEDEA